MKHVLAAAIRGYQFLLSPWLGNQCRFYPTCSEYARLALVEHGTLRGGWLALRRTLKCHPWHDGGIDLVPESRHRHGAACAGAQVTSAACAGAHLMSANSMNVDTTRVANDLPSTSKNKPEQS